MRRNLALLSAIVSTLSISMDSSASLRQYAADVVDSRWEVSVSTPLQCVLSHALPGYGEAMFTSHASKTLNMEFELDMLRLPKNYSVASVYSMPPQWMPGKATRAIAQMPIRKQFNGDLPEKTAWTMLTELEKGFWPTLYYQDWYNDADRVSVSLNASNFAQPFYEFTECVANMLPYSFDDIAYTVLSYQKNTIELTKYSQQRLAMIGEYLKADSDIELVLLDGYSDSYGGRWNNLQLSVRRAEEIQAFFTDMGVDAERISVTGHGERRHSAPNDNPSDRALNRRVVVRMSKP